MNEDNKLENLTLVVIRTILTVVIALTIVSVILEISFSKDILGGSIGILGMNLFDFAIAQRNASNLFVLHASLHH